MTIDKSNPNFKSKAGKILDSDTISNPKKDAAVIRRAYTEDKKSLLRELDLNLNKGDGKFSKQVFEKLKVTVNAKGKVNGAEYNGKNYKFKR